MSHLTKIKIEIKSLSALEIAARLCGLELRKQSTYKWYGRSVGDYPLPEGMTKEQLGHCDYALSIPGNHNAYEVGICQNGTSYSLLWDFWKGGYGLQDAIGKDGSKLITEYTLAAATEAAQAQGWYIERNGDSLAIHHPQGGIITVDASGSVDASAFQGTDCITACAPIEGALGSQSERLLKTSFYETRQSITITE
jgi:hypothetical protein